MHQSTPIIFNCEFAKYFVLVVLKTPKAFSVLLLLTCANCAHSWLRRSVGKTEEKRRDLFSLRKKKTKCSLAQTLKPFQKPISFTWKS